MNTDEPQDRSKWGLIPISLGINLFVLYVPHLWLVVEHPRDMPPSWLAVFPLVPGIVPAFILQVRGPWSLSGVWEYVVTGLFSLTILLIATAIGSINRATLVLAAILLLGYATYSVLAINALMNM